MTTSLAATLLPVSKQVNEALGLTTKVRVRGKSGQPTGPMGDRAFSQPKTIVSVIEEIGAEEWSWGLKSWTENLPRRMTKVTFLEPVRIEMGDQIEFPTEEGMWRQVKDWKLSGKAVTECVVS